MIPIIHIFQLHEASQRERARTYLLLTSSNTLWRVQEGATEETDDTEDITAYQHWMLPAREFDGLWEKYVCIYFVFLFARLCVALSAV